MARGRREFEVRVERKRDAAIALVLAISGALAALAPPDRRKAGDGLLVGAFFVASLRGGCVTYLRLVVHASDIVRIEQDFAASCSVSSKDFARVAQPGRIVAQNVSVGGGAGHGHRNDDVRGHHGGQLSADGGGSVDVDGERKVACGPLYEPPPARWAGAGPPSHHCAGSG